MCRLRRDDPGKREGERKVRGIGNKKDFRKKSMKGREGGEETDY